MKMGRLFRVLWKRFLRVVQVSVGFLLPISRFTVVGSAQQPDGGVVWEQAVRVPSPEETSSWFPDLAVDREGRVHVVWCETNHQGAADFDPADPSLTERLYYSVWDGRQWSRPNDIVPQEQDIIRNAIAVDDYDTLHLLFGASPPFGLYYKRAQASEALSAAAWTLPRLVNGRRLTYMGDIVTFHGTLHIVYDDLGAKKGECVNCADIYYRHSTDGGSTWSAPINLYPTGSGSSRVQAEMDSAGTIHVAWDEGWDRLTGHGEPRYGVYMYSTDGGNTWSDPNIISRPLVTPTVTPSPTPAPTSALSLTVIPSITPRPTVTPTVVSYPNSINAQLSPGSDGRGGVMLVWRTSSPEYPGIYYTWSTNHGGSWSEPRSIPNILARPWESSFDLYDMATDSAGHIHLLVVGRESHETDALIGVYSLVWDGTDWSTPTRVFAAEGLYPEYPKIVVHEGNQLHAVWFTREGSLWDQKVPKVVWYSRGQSTAPRQTVAPLPTSTPDPPTVTPAPAPKITPSPVVSLGDSGLPDGLYTESDDVLRLLIALLPVVLVIGVVMVVRMGVLGKLCGRK